MIKSNYEVEVLVNGKPLKEYAHEGEIFIEGRRETKFSLRLRNNSWRRKLFIPSIDGLSVMDGKECSFDSSGYIVKPYSSVTIDGWRISDNDVAEFFFSSPNKSYAKRIKKGGNLGVIGVAVFSEKERVTFNNYFTRAGGSGNSMGTCDSFAGTTFTGNSMGTCDSFAGATFTCSSTSSLSNANMVKSSVSQDIGTGWGDVKKSEVTSIEFDRENHPDEKFEIFYNTREQLENMGVNMKREPLYVTPQAFPGQYCKPPRD